MKRNSSACCSSALEVEKKQWQGCACSAPTEIRWAPYLMQLCQRASFALHQGKEKSSCSRPSHGGESGEKAVKNVTIWQKSGFAM